MTVGLCQGIFGTDHSIRIFQRALMWYLYMFTAGETGSLLSLYASHRPYWPWFSY